SPSILNASPEAATGGNIALIRTGDRLRIDLNTGRADILISEAELAERRTAFEAAGGYKYPASQTPWQEIQRGMVGELETGAVLEPAVKYHRIVDKFGLPRDNH
ncbi:MAG: dihydroxy-acid dehydratase, partial [Brevundimonas sp.]